jgi:hypothetical protein
VAVEAIGHQPPFRRHRDTKHPRAETTRSRDRLPDTYRAIADLVSDRTITA